MHRRVGLQVPGVAEDAHEEVLCRDVRIKGSGDDKADEADSVADLLDGRASRPESGRGDPDAAPCVDDGREGNVRGRDEGHAGVERLFEVLGAAHFGDDGNECGRASGGDKDGGGGNHGAVEA